MNWLKKSSVLVLALLTGGLGCSGLSAAEKAQVKAITLNYWTVFGDVDALQKLAAQYKQQRPYVTINIRQVRYDEMDKLFTNALADDVQPDIISVHSRLLKHYQARLAPMPAQVKVSRLTQTGGLKKELQVSTDVFAMPTAGTIKQSYVSAIGNDAISGSQVYGLPLSIDTLAIYYNKDLLDKAGVAEPPKTWDEFLAAAKAGTRYDRDGKIIQSGVAMGTGKNIDNSFDILSVLMMQNGVTMSGGGRVSFADGVDKAGPMHPAMQALDFYTNFARPATDAYSWNDSFANAFESFVRGQSVFYVGFAYDYNRIKSRAPEMNLDAIPLPQLAPDSPVNVANFWLESVVKKSKHQNEAWDFIRFMSQPDTLLAYNNRTLRLSPLRSQIKDQEKDPRLTPFTRHLLVAKSWYNGQNWEAARKAFDDLVTGYILPPADDKDPIERNTRLLTTAAQVIQQTF